MNSILGAEGQGRSDVQTWSSGLERKDVTPTCARTLVFIWLVFFGETGTTLSQFTKISITGEEQVFFVKLSFVT